MSIEKVVRYTSADFAKESDWFKLVLRQPLADMLAQAAQTEAAVAGLVDVLKFADEWFQNSAAKNSGVARRIQDELARWQS